MPSNLRSQIEKIVHTTRSHVEDQIENWQQATSPVQFREMEVEVHKLAREFADKLSGAILVSMSQDPALQAKTMRAAHTASSRSLRRAGQNRVNVTLLGGSKISLKVAYLAPALRKNKRGRKKKRCRRSKKGMFPLLVALGIHYGVTPALAGEICRQVADSDSVRTGREALERRGIDLGHKQTLRIVNSFGHRAVEQREQWLLDALDRIPSSGVLQGKRVVVEVDGGRIRERVVKRGRRNKQTGHHRYDAPWREPKLLTLYVVNSEGKVEQSFRPILDATLGDCDVIFTMLAGYLRALGAHEADEIILLGDGAKWIWDRAAQLFEMVGLPKERSSEMVDWYHAVETLHTVADAVKRWPKNQRECWLKRAKNALYAGEIEKLMGLFDEIAVGRRARSINKHRDYFERNKKRMQYAAAIAAHRPIGSGAVESGIRRVINMRLKANGTFWLRENAESMLLLRSYLKAGRFDDLVNWSISRATTWWDTDKIYDDGPIVESLRNAS